MAGAGGIRSTAPDMLRFAQAVLSPPDTQLGQAIELSWKQHAKPIDGSFAMGLGWNIARDGQTRFHSGQTGGYHATLFVSRRINTAVIVLSNVATPEIDVMAESIIQLCFGLPLKPREFGDLKVVDQQTMQRLVGRLPDFPPIHSGCETHQRSVDGAGHQSSQFSCLSPKRDKLEVSSRGCEDNVRIARAGTSHRTDSASERSRYAGGHESRKRPEHNEPNRHRHVAATFCLSPLFCFPSRCVAVWRHGSLGDRRSRAMSLIGESRI